MPKKQTLTVAELKALFVVRFGADQSKQNKLKARLQQEFGEDVQEKNLEDLVIQDKIVDWISDVLARRLKRNRRTTPLISSRDFAQFIRFMISEIESAEGYELEAEEREMFKKFMKTMLENVVEAVHAMVPRRKNAYDESWRWVTTVLDLAVERDILPTELLLLESATDEITRRMFTKRQFVALYNKGVNKFMDVDVLKKIIIQPMFDLVAADADEEERNELEQEFEAELMPQLRERVEKSKVIVNAWFGEEVARIYTAA